MKPEIKCVTSGCIRAIEKYGEIYHKVIYLSAINPPPSFMQDAVALCEGCGGYTNGREWKHVCKACGVKVPEGELVGMFVPHLCQNCRTKVINQQQATGSICRLCGKVYSCCCC